MRKKIFIFVSVLLVISASSIIASKYDLLSVREKNIINQTFEEIKNTEVDENDNIAKAENFVITKGRFVFFKNNMNMMAELSGGKLGQTDEELLDILLTKEFAIQEAKDKGIIVSEDEIRDFIKHQQELYYSADGSVENRVLISEIMNKRIEITGLTEEEFWESDLVKDEYARSLYLDKLYVYLLENKQIEDLNDFVDYQNGLLRQHKKSVESYL